MTPIQELSIEQTFKELSSLPRQPIRLGLQSAGGEGKTWSALTFPNPVVLNLDNKLSGYQASHPESKVRVVTFDHHLVLEVLKVSNMGFGKANNSGYPLNIRDAVLVWLTKLGQHLSPEETLLLDSWTSLQTRFDTQSKLPHEIHLTKKGEEDGFKFWGAKLTYSQDVMDLFKVLKCNVVITFHETQERDEDGRVTGKLKPLQQGQFADQIPAQLTDFYRQRCITNDHKDYEKVKPFLKTELKLNERVWMWQTASNGLFTACCSIPNMPLFVPAHYDSLTKVYTK